MTGIPVCLSKSDQKGTVLLCLHLRNSCSGEVESGDPLSKIVVERHVQGEPVVEGALKLILHEAQGRAMEDAEETWSLCLP